jgi:hypothetical protein
MCSTICCLNHRQAQLSSMLLQHTALVPQAMQSKQHRPKPLYLLTPSAAQAATCSLCSRRCVLSGAGRCQLAQQCGSRCALL